MNRGFIAALGISVAGALLSANITAQDVESSTA